MALTPSSMMPLGTTAPDFTLTSAVDERQLALHDLRGAEGTLIMFICNHCPFVIHIQTALIDFANDYKDRIGIAAINSNNTKNYPDDSPENMKRIAEKLGYPFPYLFDETQSVAHAYGAACTPDFFLFDANLKCVYRGRFDASRPGNGTPINGADLRQAAKLLLAGQDIPEKNQIPSIGCSIKWKA